jgi:glyoxylase-like metal-dependent hydrolase (beta-lactamase superfamily II)
LFRVVAIVCLALPLSLEAQAGRALVERVAASMGGTSRVLAVKTIMLRGTGENYNFGQNRTPDADLPMFAVTKYVRAMDFANMRWRQDQTREPRFVTGNTNPQRQRTGFDVVAYDITSDTSMRRLGQRPTFDRRSELLYHPVGFVQAALAPGAKVEEESARGAGRRVRLDVDGERYVMTVDSRTMLPSQIERTVAQPVIGDAVFAHEFPQWFTASSGVRVPLQVVHRLDGRWKVGELRFDGVTVDGDVGDITIPESVKTAALVPQAVNVTADTIAPGVWLIAGGSHHSVAIEMKDHLVLVEAPQSDDRALAAIRAARALRPDPPLRAVINTHHHFDHAGGIRAAMGEGLTVITHATNRRFFEDLAKRKFTILPDHLAKNPKAAVVEGVAGRRTLTDGSRTVNLYELPGNEHSRSMLIVHLPAEKLLIEADVYSPPAPGGTTVPPMPFAKNLVENIDRLGLAVERVVPIHGRVVPVEELRAVAK